MKIVTPNYYDEFKCAADKCKDNCCIGWEIDIDEKTFEKYNSINGRFGQKLKSNIVKNDDIYSFKLSNNRCPFLNENNLCDIIINLGEENICEICKCHPRFFEWFQDSTEIGLGLCCEESAKIIITNKNKVQLTEKYISCENDDCNYNKELYDYIYSFRKKAFKIMQNRNKSINERFLSLLYITNTAENEIYKENKTLYIDDISSKTNEQKASYYNKLIDIFQNFEVLENEWFITLNNVKNSLLDIVLYEKEFDRYYVEYELQFEQLAVYFLYRYIIKSVYDKDILTKVIFTVISCMTIKLISIYKWLSNDRNFNTENIIDIAKHYSKEIEYSDENMENITEKFYDNDMFLIDNIISILI